MSEAPPSFAADVRPLFRPKDLSSMARFFDLGSYDDVSRHAEAIWQRVEAGSMPCDGMWPEESVSLFRRWIDTGKAP
jgi:hypothetical protein